MLKIDSNQTIRLSRGDDVTLPLFINAGTVTAPVRYKFQQKTPANGEFVKLSIYNINDHKNSEPVLVKIYQDNGDILTWRGCCPPEVLSGFQNVNQYGDMNIRLFRIDTINLDPGEYRYQLEANLIREDAREGARDFELYKQVTVTNKLRLYLITDDYSSRVWGSMD